MKAQPGLRQKVQQAEFRERQIDRLASEQDFVPARMNDQVVYGYRRLVVGRLFRAATQHRFHPRHQDARAEWLGDVVLGPQLQPRDDVGLFTLGGEHQYGNVLRTRIGLQTPADFQPVDGRQQQIEQDQIGHVPPRRRERLFAGRDANDSEAFLVQVVADELEKILLVVDNKHSFS